MAKRELPGAGPPDDGRPVVKGPALSDPPTIPSNETN